SDLAYDPVAESTPLGWLAPDGDTARTVRDHLLRVGIDHVAGYTTGLDGLPTARPALVAPADLERSEAALVLDVRNKTEHAAGHIPGSEQLSAGRVLWHLDAVPDGGTVVAYGQGGARSAVAAGAVRRAGYVVVDLDGSSAGWSACDEPRRGTRDAPA